MKSNSIQGSNRGSVLWETISSRIHEIKEEMYPLEEKLAPMRDELNYLLIQQKRIRLNATEKQSSLNHHLKLITLLRKILIAGIPVFITGDTRVGKTVLAREIASYEFPDVTYLGRDLNFTKETENQFTNAINNYKSSNQLLILDEYQYLKDAGIELTKDYLNQYTGSLMVITQNSSNLPTFELFSEFYIVNLEHYFSCDYTIQHFVKNVQFEGKGRFLNYGIDVPLTTKCALTVSSVLDYLQLHILNNNDGYYKGQYLAALNKLESQLNVYVHDYNVKSIVPILEKIAATEPQNYTENLIALSKSAINLQELAITGEIYSDSSELGRFHAPPYYNIVEETSEINIKKDYPEKEIYKVENS